MTVSHSQAELNEEELKEKAEWEAEKEALFREAQAKQAAIKAQKEADAAAKKVIDDGEAAKLAKQRAKLALRKAAEAAAEGGVLESLRDPDRVPVAQTDEQAAEYSAKEAGMKATIEEINSRTFNAWCSFKVKSNSTVTVLHPKKNHTKNTVYV